MGRRSRITQLNVNGVLRMSQNLLNRGEEYVEIELRVLSIDVMKDIDHFYVVNSDIVMVSENHDSVNEHEMEDNFLVW